MQRFALGVHLIYAKGIEKMRFVMKKRRLLKLVFCVAFAFLLACDDDGYSLDKAWYSIATVNPLSDNAYSLTLDNGTTLWPAATDIPWYEPKTKRRVQVIYTILSDNFQGYSHAVKILDIQNILTKEIVKNMASIRSRYWTRGLATAT